MVKDMIKIIKGSLILFITVVLVIVPLGLGFVVQPPAIDARVLAKAPEHKYATAYVFPENQTEIWINRTVYTSEFLHVKIVDEINISNTKNRPFSAIQIYYDRKFWENLVTVKVLGKYGNDTARPIDYYIHYASEDYIGVTVHFYVYLDKYISVLKNTFRVFLIFEQVNVVEVKSLNDKIGLYLNMTPCPFLPYPVKNLRVGFKAPEDTTVEIDDVVPVSGRSKKENDIFYKFSEIPPMNFSLGLSEQIKRYKFDSPVRVVWSTNTPPIAISYAERDILITQSYEIIVEDKVSLSIISIGPPADSPENTKWKLSSIRIGLAQNVSDIILTEDDVGKIKYDNTTDKDIRDDIRTIKLNFLRPVLPGEIRNVSVKYVIKLKDGFLQENDIFNVSIPFCPILNTTINTYVLRIRSYVPVSFAFPKENIASSDRYGAEKFFLAIYRDMSYGFIDVNPSENLIVNLLIRYDIRYSVRTYLILTLYIILVSIIIIEISLLARTAMLKIISPVEVKRTKKIEQFVKAYETIIAYDKKTWADAYENLIVKRPTAAFIDEFRRRNVNITQQYEKLIPSIDEIKEIPELYDTMIELRKVEERINMLKQLITNITVDFVSGKMDSDVFQNRCEALLLELKDNINMRERLINNVRDYYLSKLYS